MLWARPLFTWHFSQRRLLMLHSPQQKADCTVLFCSIVYVDLVTPQQFPVRYVSTRLSIRDLPFLPLTPPNFPTEGRKAEREITGSVEASWKLFVAGSSFSDLGFPLPPLIMMLNWTRPQEQPVALCQDTQQGPLCCCDWWTSLGDAQNAVLPEAAASHRKAVEMQAWWSGQPGGLGADSMASTPSLRDGCPPV